MKDKDKNKVRNLNIVSTRISPESEKKFQRKLKETGDSTSEVLRRAIRDYSKD